METGRESKVEQQIVVKHVSSQAESEADAVSSCLRQLYFWTAPLTQRLKSLHTNAGSSRSSGAEGILGEVVSPIQVSYLSKSVSTSRFRICRSLNISLGSEGEIIFLVFFGMSPAGIKGATDQMLP